MPRIRKKIPLPVLIATVLTVAVVAWLAESEREIRYKAPPIDQQADYYMENFQLTETNAQGEAIRWLHGERLARYPEETRLSQPRLILEFNDQRHETWTLSAEEGHIYPQRSLASFNDNVVVRRQNTLPQETLELQTSSLFLDFDAQIAQTDAQVSMTQPGGIIQAQGMELNFEKRQIQLLSEVDARYVPQ